MNNKHIGVEHRLGSVTSPPFEFQDCFSKILSLRMERGQATIPNSGSDYLSDYGQEILNANSSSITAFTPPTDVDLREKNIDNFRSKDTLQSLVQSCICGSSQGLLSPEKPTGHEPLDNIHNSFLCFQKNIDVENYKFHQEKQCPSQMITTTIASTNFDSEKLAMKNNNKSRIRWTEDLHKKFIDCVNRLGGAKKATPKGILKLMNCEGLTIFHVKSHLQKIRSARLMPESTEENVEQIDTKKGLQIVEALRVQMDVQRRLYEQLENQKKLQARIEEQAKQLQTMIKCQLKTK